MEEYLQAGTILSPHALKGEVKVYPAAGDPHRFEDLREVYIRTAAGYRALEIERARCAKNLALVKFRGLDRIEDVENLRKKELLVRREDALELDEDEYYTADLIGMEVSDESGARIGVLADILPTGANDVYIIRRDTPAGAELLLPAIHDCILEVDVENGTMTVRVPEGL